MTVRRGIILSDLDGTFLNEAYRPVLPATEFADVLKRWRVIWTTSRTVDEVLWLQRLLRQRDDAIAENGGVCLTYRRDVAEKMGRVRPLDDAFVSVQGDGARATLSLVDQAFASVGRRVDTFCDLTPSELAKRAHYAVQDAVRAQRRVASVVLTSVDMTDGATQVALAWLSRRGCSVSVGSQWTTVVGGADKGSGAQKWLAAIGNQVPVIAIGDGDNDAPLLGMADRRFVVRRPSGGHHPSLAAIDRAHLLQSIGTLGWCEMLDVIDHDGRSS